MNAYQIFQQIDPDLATQIFTFLRKDEKETYQGVIATLAEQRKLRPVFILKKTPADQVTWLCKMARMKMATGIDEHVLQMWLLKQQRDLLTDFLDAMEIKHDGEGSVDNLPDELDADKLAAAVDQLIGKHPQENVKIYLHVFQMQKINGWPTLGALLENDERLHFSTAD
ncbi:MAG: hypothetical protein L3J39_01990 [Verrucomicrobiales bacterium]|nr:hypothetical protein [Verrucomicrobiales bacterium]